MIICPNCSRENENHYKFCLGCGTELSQANAQVTIPPEASPRPEPRPTPMAPPMATALPVGPPMGPPVAAPVMTGRPTTKPPTQRLIDSIAPAGAAPPPSDAMLRRPDLDAEAELGTINRGAFVNLPGADPTVIGAQERFNASPTRNCRACNAVVPEGFKFCGVCGTRYEPPAVARPVQSTVSAQLVLIHPDGTEGEVFPLGEGDTVIGRDSAIELFADDPFLSPRHATFHIAKGRLTLRDDGSLNGVFVRITSEVELGHRDMFRVGQQLLRFEDMRQVAPVVGTADDGTITYGSPNRGIWGRLATVVSRDATAAIWTLSEDVVHLGRERGDVLFPQDGFVSGSHCRLSTRQGRFFLEDPGSTNGTYFRVKGEYTLAPNDLLLLGQQLFRFHLS